MDVISIPYDYDYVIKLLLIGNSAVGKSSIITRYVEDSFTSSFISTIGIDFKIKTVMYNDKKVKLMIWDTAGQERFRTINTAYYRGAMGILIVYDITNNESFSSITGWMKTIDDYKCGIIHKMLVGNKSDRADRVITREMGENFAKQYDVTFYETSAKTKNDDNINIIFNDLTTKIINEILHNDIEKDKDVVNLSTNDNKLYYFKKYCTIL